MQFSKVTERNKMRNVGDNCSLPGMHVVSMSLQSDSDDSLALEILSNTDWTECESRMGKLQPYLASFRFQLGTKVSTTNDVRWAGLHQRKPQC